MKKKNRFLANKTFVVFSILAVCIILTAVFAPVVTRGVDPLKGSLVDALLPPCKEHIFGTDKMGRDIFSRVIYGARASLSATFGVVALIFLVGTVTGVLAGYFGGVIDAVIMRIADMMLAFPGLVLALAVAGIMGASIKNAIIAIVVVSWTKYARLSRSLVLQIKRRDYVEAAIVNGGTSPHILWVHILPNILPMMVITAAADIGALMMELAGLSFLGLGAKPPVAEWGSMMSDTRSLMTTSPWITFSPGIAIFISVMIFNLLGDTIRDYADPKSRR